MIISLAGLAVVGLALIAFGAPLGRRAFFVAAAAMGAVTVWLATEVPSVVDGVVPSDHFVWVRGLDLNIDLRLDGLALTMSLIVAGVGVAVCVFAARYFAPRARDLGRLSGLLVLFGGAMLGLVQAEQLLVLFICWELTSITSFLLIGNRHTESRARAAALQALLVTGAGGLAMLAGLVLLAEEAGTYQISELVANPPADTTTTTVALVLILIGAFTKSAQYPFHSWLPNAMAAPTPVSAYLHSATMVTAGVFLVARLAPIFATYSLWRPLVLTVGCATLVFGGLRALRQHDLKLLLAFGTVSQLGLMMVLFGAGTPATATDGWVLIVAHAAFKATLFMVVGMIDEQTGTRDIRAIPPLGHQWRPVRIVAFLAAASMAGVPLTAGFVAKELAYDDLGDVGLPGGDVVLAVIVVGSMLTVAYAIRFYWGAFVLPQRRAGELGSTAPPRFLFLAPAAVLAAFGIVLGLVPGIADPLATASLTEFGPGAGTVDLELWHGIEPLLLSLVTLGGGIALFVFDRRVQPLLARGRRIPSGSEVYLQALRGIGVVSSRVTGAVQSGSLPIYAGVILATAAAAAIGALLLANDWPAWPTFGPIDEAPIAGVLLVAGFAAAMIRRRFSAAVLLGVAGYAMAGIFVLSGAPDLALTQVAVETLSTVVFVLVLRRLPEGFERQSSSRRRVVRVIIAAAVGVSVFLFALVAAGFRLTPPVSEEMVARSVSDGHGRNVVNVILVDFRGFDTMGEITVLAVASIGAVALARVGRRVAEERGQRTTDPEQVRRLAFVDVSVQIVFFAVLMTSLWLLFSGHNQPGGGFVGGLLAGSAITLRYIAGGIDEVRGRSRFRPWTVLGSGLLLAAVTATLPILFGGSVLEVAYTTVDVPGFGDVHLSSALAFDTGVYLAVIGMVLMAFEAFGDRPREAVG